MKNVTQEPEYFQVEYPFEYKQFTHRAYLNIPNRRDDEGLIITNNNINGRIQSADGSIGTSELSSYLNGFFASIQGQKAMTEFIEKNYLKK